MEYYIDTKIYLCIFDDLKNDNPLYSKRQKQDTQLCILRIISNVQKQVEKTE